MASGVFAALSAIGTGFKAFSQHEAAEERAAQKEFELEQKRKDLEASRGEDRLQAVQKQQEINERLDRALAQRKALQSRSNVAVGSGSAEYVREEGIESASEAKERVATNLALNRLEKESRINQLKINEEYVPEQIEQRGDRNMFQSLFSAAIQGGQAYYEIGGPSSGGSSSGSSMSVPDADEAMDFETSESGLGIGMGDSAGISGGSSGTSPNFDL